MTDVAVILPTPLLERMGMINKFHLILPQNLANDVYRNYYERATGTKILDNGAAEDYAFSADHLMGMARAIGANEVVVPDRLRDGAGTVELAEQFPRYTGPADGLKFIGVAQGRTPLEVESCIRAFADLKYITILALPRLLDRELGPWGRIHTLEANGSLIENNFEAVHFLGATSQIDEVRHLRGRRPPVRSMDTSLPVQLAKAGHDIEDETIPTRAVIRDIDFFEWEPASPREVNLVIHNCTAYQNWGLEGFEGEDNERCFD